MVFLFGFVVMLEIVYFCKHGIVRGAKFLFMFLLWMENSLKMVG